MDNRARRGWLGVCARDVYVTAYQLLTPSLRSAEIVSRLRVASYKYFNVKALLVTTSKSFSCSLPRPRFRLFSFLISHKYVALAILCSSSGIHGCKNNSKIQHSQSVFKPCMILTARLGGQGTERIRFVPIDCSSRFRR